MEPRTAQNYVQALSDHGMTQAQIAARTGITQASVSKIMRGAVKDVMSLLYRALQDLHAEVVERRPRRRKPTRKLAGKVARKRGAGR